MENGLENTTCIEKKKTRKQNVQLKRSLERDLSEGYSKINRILLRVVNSGLFP